MALPRADTDLYREIAARPNFSIHYLEDFTSEQVSEYLHKRCGTESPRVIRFINKTYDLESLSKKPVLLDMIVSSADRLQYENNTVNPGLLYRVCTDIWLSRNDWSSALTVDNKKRLLGLLAVRIAREPDFQLHYDAIPGIIADWDPEVSQVDAQAIDAELRTASFLVRNRNGMYRFSHKSFQEFFFAIELIEASLRNATAIWNGAFFRTEVYRFMRDLLATEAGVVNHLLTWLADEKLSTILRANVAKCIATSPEPQVTDQLIAVSRTTQNKDLLAYLMTALGSRQGPEAEDVLIEFASGPPHGFIFANALTSLARIGTPKTTAFVKNVLETAILDHHIIPFYWAAGSFNAPSITGSVLRSFMSSPLATSSKAARIEKSCLELCRHFPSPDSERFVEWIIETSHSSQSAAQAYRTLDPSRRLALLDKFLHRLEKGEWRDADIIESLSGIKDDRVKRSLIATIDRAAPRYPLLAAAAFDVLSASFPDAVGPEEQKWIDRGQKQPAFLRVRRARDLVERRGKEAIPSIEELLDPKEHVSVKRAALDLIFETDPAHLPDVVARTWPREPTVLIKRHALDLVYRVDRERAVRLMLEHGLFDTRAGMRIVACKFLGTESSRQATQRLLERLQTDDSPWVRRQALRSLVSPGRAIEAKAIMHATQKEQDPIVLELRSQLLGKESR